MIALMVDRSLRVVIAAAMLSLIFGLAAAACGNDDDGGGIAEPGLYTQAFVEDAVLFYERNGRDALIGHFNSPDSTDPPSVDGQWYGFVVGLDGVVLAHPTIPENVGQTIAEILGDTHDDRAVADEMVTATEAGKWVDYTYLNPQSGNQETKHTWILRKDDILVASGWYESG